MKEFKNIPSKLYEKTEDWIEKEKNATKMKFGDFPKRPNSTRRPMSASMSTKIKPSITNTNFNIKKNPEEKLSMFENYYHDKLVEKNILPNDKEIALQEQKENLDLQYEQQLRDLRAFNNIENQINEQYESIKKAQLKANTPTVNEKGVILEKTNKNFVIENKKITPKNIKPAKSMDNPFHKEYGKTPKYIQNMREETALKNEIEKQRKEEAKYPQGTRLLSEEERIFTLNKLLESKKDIEQLIAKLPITLASQAAKNKQQELFKKLDEIEGAIDTFSRKKVFVKVNS